MTKRQHGSLHGKGAWKVTAWCCTSGLCIDCHRRGNHGDRAKRQRRIISYNISRELAERTASNWLSYEARAERMLSGEEII